MTEVMFLQDYRGVLTEERYYTKGTVASFPDKQASALIEAGRATAVVEKKPVKATTRRRRTSKARTDG